MLSWITQTDRTIERLLTYLKPWLLLLTRLWVAQVFFRAGMLKFTTWSSTLYLFQYEYHVPVLSPVFAAWLGTGIELIVPVFLALGFLTRPFALFLFVYNIMAVVSYPVLWKHGFLDHQLWGLMMLVNAVWGAGWLSVDGLVGRWTGRRPLAST